MTGPGPSPASLEVEAWTVSARPPDKDGDSLIEARAVVVYEGYGPAHLARLRWTAFDPTGQVPLAQGEGDVLRDIDNGDDVELEASNYAKLGDGAPPGACRVEAQILVFPGEPSTLLTESLPEVGMVGSRPAPPGAGAATLVSWRLACAESAEDSASYSLTLVVRNDGPAMVAALTARVRVRSRKGDVWATEFVQSEQLAPGEQRVLESSFCVSERARARKGATLEVLAIACTSPVVGTLPAISPAIRSSESDEPTGSLEPEDDGGTPGGGRTESQQDSPTAASQDDILARIVDEFRKDPRNKLLIGANDLLAWSAIELGRPVSGQELCAALGKVGEGHPVESDEQVVDAATSLCHQAADRCFGKQAGPEEWEEVDISTDWCDYEDGDPEKVYVIVRPC